MHNLDVKDKKKEGHFNLFMDWPKQAGNIIGLGQEQIIEK